MKPWTIDSACIGDVYPRFHLTDKNQILTDETI